MIVRDSQNQANTILPRDLSHCYTSPDEIRDVYVYTTMGSFSAHSNNQTKVNSGHDKGGVPDGVLPTVWTDNIYSGRASNPFTPGTPVSTPHMFFGRERELSALQDRIRTGTNTAVVGPSEIGVSSLLRQAATSQQSEGTLIAYIDLTEMAAPTADEVAKMLWSQWWLQIRSGYVPEIGGMSVLEPLARRLAAAGHKPVAILDRYEQILWRPSQFGADFVAQLQALIGQGILVLITGTHGPLAELHQQAGSSSTLYLQLVQQDIGLLTEAAAVDLLTLPMQRAGHQLVQADGQSFVNLAGPHPLFLQLVGTYLFSAFESNQYTREHVEALFKTAAEPYWQELWLNLSPPTRAALSTKEVKGNDRLVTRQTRDLRRKGLVTGDGPSTQLFSQGFAEWIDRQNRAAQWVQVAPEESRHAPRDATPQISIPASQSSSQLQSD